MKITLVTITYNAADTLPATLDSVSMQDYDHVEHLIIDGASTDGTLEIARKYAEQAAMADNGHEVTVLSEPDNGLYDAMNKGRMRATGDYVCFLNAGDRLPDTDTLSKVAETAQAAADGCAPAVVYGDTDIIDGEGRFLGHRHLSVPEQLSWRSFKNGMLVCHQAFYARTDIAQKVDYDTHYRFSADFDWCLRILKVAEQQQAPTSRVPGVIALYLKEGQTTLHHRESLRERYDVMCRHYGTITTMAMHTWFCIRAAWRTISKSDRHTSTIRQ